MFKAFGVKLTHFDNVEDSVYENIDLFGDASIDSQGWDDERITYNSAETTKEVENSPWLPRHLRCCVHTLSVFATTDLIKTIRSPQNSQLNEIHTSVMKKCTLLWNASYRPKSAEVNYLCFTVSFTFIMFNNHKLTHNFLEIQVGTLYMTL